MIPVTKPYLPDINKYKAYIDEIYASGWLTNHGPLVQRLEEKLEKYLGVKNLLLVANGSLALHLAYKLLEIKGEVITTPFSFVATTSTLVWENITPVFSDIDNETFNINPSLIENKITKNTSAILPVHVFGNPCDVEKIQQIADRHKLKVIYDAAHAFGVNYKGQSVFNHGDISTLSFHATKIFHTIEGGALIIKDDALYDKAKKMINFGMRNGEVDCMGTNLKMNEFQAAMGLAVLDDMPLILEKRKKLWMNYYDAFKPVLKLQKHQPELIFNYHYFPVVFESELKLLKVEKILNNKDIYPRRYFKPSLDTLNYLNAPKNKMPESLSLSSRVLSLPLFDELDGESQELIIDTILGAI